MPTDKGIPDRKAGNWSGSQRKEPRPGERKNSQAGQREHTEPSIAPQK